MDTSQFSQELPWRRDGDALKLPQRQQVVVPGDDPLGLPSERCIQYHVVFRIAADARPRNGKGFHASVFQRLDERLRHSRRTVELSLQRVPHLPKEFRRDDQDIPFLSPPGIKHRPRRAPVEERGDEDIGIEDDAGMIKHPG